MMLPVVRRHDQWDDDILVSLHTMEDTFADVMGRTIDLDIEQREQCNQLWPELDIEQ